MWYVVSAKKTNSQNTLTDLSTSCFKCAYERETEKWLWLCDDRLSTTNKIEHTNRAQSNIETNGGQFSIFQFEIGQITRNSQIELKIAVTWSLSGSLSLSLSFSQPIAQKLISNFAEAIYWIQRQRKLFTNRLIDALKAINNEIKQLSTVFAAHSLNVCTSIACCRRVSWARTSQKQLFSVKFKVVIKQLLHQALIWSVYSVAHCNSLAPQHLSFYIQKETTTFYLAISKKESTRTHIHKNAWLGNHTGTFAKMRKLLGICFR